MIPKLIHFFHFKEIENDGYINACVENWKKCCPDYQIIEWNIENVNIIMYPDEIQRALKNGAWEYVEEYLSLDIIYRYGGIYLPSDVQLYEGFDRLAECEAFFGFVEGNAITPGIGFGAKAGSKILQELIETYSMNLLGEEKAIHVKETSLHLCMYPFLKRGLEQNGTTQMIEGNILILSEEDYIHPKTRITSGRIYGKNAIHSCWKYGSRIYRYIRKSVPSEEKNLIRKTKNRILYNKKLKRVSNISCEEAKATIESCHFKRRPCFSQKVTYIDEFDLMIVVPVYKVEKYIRQCIESVLAQKTKYSFVAVFVDDGSPDRCGEILEEYKNHNCIRIIHQENRGFSGARNRALENICGKYIMFLDSDDYIPNYCVEALLDAAFRHNADVVEGAHVVFNNEWMSYPEMKTTREKLVETRVLSGYPWGKVLRSTLFMHTCFPMNMWYEDTIMHTLIYPECAIAVSIPNVVYYYRKNPEGISATSAGKINCIDTYWITQYYLEEKKKRNHVFQTEEYRQFLAQCRTNQSRINRMPETVQESIFVLTCKLKQEYFEGIHTPNGSNYQKLEETINKRSYQAYNHVLSDWGYM